jgi:hypothetical protein
MKRITTIMMVYLLFTATAAAQAGLNINRLFNENLKTEEWVTQELNGKTEIIVTGKKAKEMGLSIYHSLSLSNSTKTERDNIVNLLAKDAAQALDRDVEYRNGQLYYGFYTLRPNKKNKRYIFYLNQNLARKSPKNVVTIIYMEGKKSPEEVKKLIRK